MKIIVKFSGRPLHFWQKGESAALRSVASVATEDFPVTEFPDQQSADTAVGFCSLDDAQITYHEKL